MIRLINRLDKHFSVRAIFGEHLDLNQFVVGERPANLRHHTLAQTIPGNGDDRFQMMADGAEFFLICRFCHNCVYPGTRRAAILPEIVTQIDN